MIWLAVVATAIVASIIHIAAVLGVPHLATNNAWSRLSGLAETNTMVMLPPASAEAQVLPLLAPDMRYAVCRYDVSAGPVRVSTQLLDDVWLITLFTPQGDNFYAISGGDLKRSRVEMILSTEAEALLQLEADAVEGAENIVVVRVPQPTGIAMIRAPLRGPSFAARTEAALQRASCGSQPTTAASQVVRPALPDGVQR